MPRRKLHQWGARRIKAQSPLSGIKKRNVTKLFSPANIACGRVTDRDRPEPSFSAERPRATAIRNAVPRSPLFPGQELGDIGLSYVFGQSRREIKPRAKHNLSLFSHTNERLVYLMDIGYIRREARQQWERPSLYGIPRRCDPWCGRGFTGTSLPGIAYLSPDLYVRISVHWQQGRF